MTPARSSNHRGKVGIAIHNAHEFMKEKKDVYLWISDELVDAHPASESLKDDVKNDPSFYGLENLELYFYEKRYSESLNEQNQKYIAKRNYSRVKTLEDIYKSKRYQPTEEINQYGNMKTENQVTKEDFIEMMTEYVQWKIDWSKSHGNHLHVLDFSCHFDESTPHCHTREVWDYTDDNGVIHLDQEKGMEQAGLELPEPGKEKGRFNNRNMTFTKMSRDKWNEILIAHGYEVILEPEPRKRKHQKGQEFQDEMNRKYFQEQQDKIDEQSRELNDREEFLDYRVECIDKREKAIDERDQNSKKINSEAQNNLKEAEAIKDSLNTKLNEFEDYKAEYDKATDAKYKNEYERRFQAKQDQLEAQNAVKLEEAKQAMENSLKSDFEALKSDFMKKTDAKYKNEYERQFQVKQDQLEAQNAVKLEEAKQAMEKELRQEYQSDFLKYHDERNKRFAERGMDIIDRSALDTFKSMGK